MWSLLNLRTQALMLFKHHNFLEFNIEQPIHWLEKSAIFQSTPARSLSPVSRPPCLPTVRRPSFRAEQEHEHDDRALPPSMARSCRAHRARPMATLAVPHRLAQSDRERQQEPARFLLRGRDEDRACRSIDQLHIAQ